MDLILFAHHNWGVKTIQTINNTEHNILHVFVHPDNMDENEVVWYESVKNECIRLNIPFSVTKNVTDDNIDLIHHLSPDLIFLVGWRRLIPKSIIDIPKKGVINIHEALLPSYRGFAPLNWAIINGETEIGITAHFVDETADTGDIILQKKIPINFLDDAIDVHNNLLELIPTIVVETLEKLASKNFNVISQKNVKGFVCSRRFPDDGQINWNDDRITIYNKIRALSDPFPNAFCFFENEKIFIKNAIVLDKDYRGPPGRICGKTKEGIIITCGNNFKENQAILITKISVNGIIQNSTDFFKNLWLDLS